MNTKYISYIPPVLGRTKEFKAIGKTVDAYFNNSLWKDVTQQFDNQYIASCDEQGIAYYEKICGLTTGENDTLETRKALVLAKWIDQLPYNYRALLQKLDIICGPGEYEILPHFDKYTIGLLTHSVKNIEAVEKLLKEVVPCNIVVDINNEIEKTVSAKLTVGASVTVCKHITIGG